MSSSSQGRRGRTKWEGSGGVWRGLEGWTRGGVDRGGRGERDEGSPKFLLIRTRAARRGIGDGPPERQTESQSPPEEKWNRARPLPGRGRERLCWGRWKRRERPEIVEHVVGDQLHELRSTQDVERRSRVAQSDPEQSHARPFAPPPPCQLTIGAGLLSHRECGEFCLGTRPRLRLAIERRAARDA